MAGLRATFDNAVARHLSAVGRLNAVQAALDAAPPTGPDAASVAAESGLAQRLSAAAASLRDDPRLVHIGHARLHESSFPVLVPFVGTGHLAFSQDSREPRVAALMRAVLLRAMASARPGMLEIEAVDAATVGASLAALQPLADARLMRVTTDAAGLERVLAACEDHVKAVLRGERSTKLVLVLASTPELNDDIRGRIDALARSGVAGGVHLLAGGFAGLPAAVSITVADDMRIGNPPDAPIGAAGLNAPVAFDRPLTDDYVRAEAHRIADLAKAAAELRFADLAPDRLWSEDPSEGLSTLIGRDSQGVLRLSFDDETPHWLVGGRTGGGKTVFLLDVLYGLAARYSPDDLALYLLDFKEGVSFTEFTPQPSDPAFIPHARAVGVESDREYGVAILRELDAEMTRRSVVMKRHGVARYSQLRGAENLPRILCVIDEFQVLFAGNDKLAREAVGLLENLARKGRSYGVHMILASQTTSGIEALYTKKDSIFGQFPLRVALPGANSVLDHLNPAAQGLRTGEVVVNADGGVAGRDRKVRFPNAHAESELLHQLRHDMWSARADAAPPSVFYGYASVHLDEDPRFEQLTETPRPRVLLGRRVNATLDTAEITLDNTPGRHLSIIGADVTGAHLLHAAALSLRRQRPQARYLIAALAEPGIAQATAAAIGEDAELVTAEDLPAVMAELTETALPAFLIGFGLDAANLTMDGRKALTALLRGGPASGIHLLGWWRGLRRFTDDIGGSAGREDVSCSVVLNVPGGELFGHFGQSVMDWNPRPGRGLLIDRHANVQDLMVPFTLRETA